MPDSKTVVKSGSEKSISPAVIKRLPRYYRYLGDLLKNNVVRISSKELSQRMNVTASQIRQDLNNFGGFGQQGYGYNVRYLYSEIGKILGLDRVHNMIFVGAGNLGQALANYAVPHQIGKIRSDRCTSRLSALHEMPDVYPHLSPSFSLPHMQLLLLIFQIVYSLIKPLFVVIF